MTLFKWSRTASSNDVADSTCPFPENMAAGALNDGTRGMMAAVAKYRDDVSGQLVTGGTSTAFTLATFQGFTTLALMHGKTIFFTPHTTNGANGTSLNVDGLGVKPILTAPGKGLPGGVLIQGTPYGVVYNNTDGAFYVQGYFGDPYGIPISGGLDYWGTVLPNSSFAFPIGQAISRVTYADLFNVMGTTHGAGDGTTTFNLPDKRGRVSAMKEDAASRLTATYFGGNSTNIGATGGSELNNVLLTHDHDVFLKDNQHKHTASKSNFGNGSGPGQAAGTGADTNADTSMASSNITIGSVTGVANDNKTAAKGSANAHNIVQPTIICNYMIRII